MMYTIEVRSYGQYEYQRDSGGGESISSDFPMVSWGEKKRYR